MQPLNEATKFKRFTYVSVQMLLDFIPTCTKEVQGRTDLSMSSLRTTFK